MGNRRRLKDATVRGIRAMYLSPGESYRTVALYYGVSHMMVSRIIRGIYYAEVV